MEGAEKCIKCPLGTYKNGDTGYNKCELCPAGTYGDKEGMSSCSSCNPGYYSSIGETSCHICPAGTHTNIQGYGASHCIKCTPGRYAEKGEQICYKCPAGTFSSSNNEKCIKCPGGTYSEKGLLLVLHAKLENIQIMELLVVTIVVPVIILVQILISAQNVLMDTLLMINVLVADLANILGIIDVFSYFSKVGVGLFQSWECLAIFLFAVCV